MASKALIANVACHRMGISRIIANVDTEQSQEAISIAAVFDHERDLVLRSWFWPWATAYATLALVDGSADDPFNDDWIYAYRYPSDCLFARRLVTSAGRLPSSADQALIWGESRPPDFRVGRDAQGRLLYSNEADAVLEYTVRVTDVEEFDPLFVSLLAWRLVMAVGPALSRLEKIADTGLRGFLLEHPWASSVAANEQQAPRADQDAPWIAGR
jgi:hypothetical protein